MYIPLFINQVLIGAGRGRKDLEDALEVPEMEKLDFTPLPSFCPSGLPGAPSVSMKTAIALINRCVTMPVMPCFFYTCNAVISCQHYFHHNF